MVNPSARRGAADVTQIRIRLVAIADGLEQRQDALAAAEGAIGEEVLDEVDRAQRVSEIRFTIALESAVSEARVQIAHALDVLDEGGYGVCEDCRAQIGKARLAFRPESTRCLPCQSAADRQSGLDYGVLR